MSAVLATVQSAPRIRRPAQAVAIAMIFLFAALLLAPWQQTASGVGRVVALSPTDRAQVVDAPIKGRVKKWHVVEGSVVKTGDPIVELTDVDPNYVGRLQQQRAAIEARRGAAEAQAAAYDRQVDAYDKARVMAVEAAERKIDVAARKVDAAKTKLEAERGGLKAARLNLTRKSKLVDEGLASRRDGELAELAVTKAETGVGAAEAALQESKATLIASRAERMVKESEFLAKVASADGSAKKAAADAAKAAAELTKIDVQLARQESRLVTAPTDGVVLRLEAGLGAEIVKESDPLATIVPETSAVAVEVWVDGNDVPLVQESRKVRLQFEGWPAVQFAGWPSVAVGTFGGIVSVVDAQSRRGGQFRALVVPDPEGEPWPSGRYLRQGVKSKAWVLLDEVRLGYELWRRANGFPATAAPVVASDDEAEEKKK
ncbi:MAG: HlyD family efflux transporter periplasmic adaptor subunit [Deltaproteobacteria bacterium]